MYYTRSRPLPNLSLIPSIGITASLINGFLLLLYSFGCFSTPLVACYPLSMHRAKFGLVDMHAMHDHCKLSCHCYGCFLQALLLHKPEPPAA